MTINPVFLLLAIYFLANFYAFLNSLVNGGFEAYGYFYNTTTLELLFVFAIQSISLFGLLIFFRIEYRKYRYTHFSIGDGAGYSLLTLTIAYLAFTQYYGAGIAGSDFNFENTNYLNYIFVLIQPDVWFYLIGPNLRSKKIFWICAVVFLMSLILRGWMGGVMLIAITLLAREYPVKIKINNIILLTFILIALVALLPILDAFKWGMRVSMPVRDIVDLIFDLNYFDVFPIVLQSVVDRFQNFNYVVYVLEDRSNMINQIMSGNINWFFQGGIFNSIYCKMMSCGKDIGIFLAEGVSGQSDLSWNVDVGISGWMAILGWGFFFYIGFSILVLSLGYRLFGTIFGLTGVMIFGAFSFIYYFHGWNNAFFNLIIYAFAYRTLRRVRMNKTTNCKSQKSHPHHIQSNQLWRLNRAAQDACSRFTPR